MLGIATKYLVTSGLEALGVETTTAKTVGTISGTVVSVLTADVVSASVDAAVCVSDATCASLNVAIESR